MSKLSIIDAKDFEKMLITLGFKVKRQKSSRVFYKDPAWEMYNLSHPSIREENLNRSLIRQILKEIRLTPEEFLQLLANI